MRAPVLRSSALRLAVAAVVVTPVLSGCALGIAAGAATVGAASAVVGTTAKVAVKTTGAVIDAATPGDDDNKSKERDAPK